MSKKYYTSERSQQIVLSLLKEHGIRKVVASPGTTNLTLVASMQQDPWFEIYSSVDERSAAYLACGIAAESGESVVLSCTGATASRNYMPGLTEAFYRKLPILAITANQGREKIGHLVAQNIDRTVVPNDIAVTSVFVAACKDADDEKNCEILVNKAILSMFSHGGGPAHINLSTTYSRDYSVLSLPEVRSIKRYNSYSSLPELPSGRTAIFIGSHQKWSEYEEKCLEDFCKAHNAVAFCDHTSGYKGKYRVLFSLVGAQHMYHSRLLSVDTLIHIGEVSGDYYTNIDAKRVWRVSEDGELRDTFGKLTDVFEMKESFFFERYTSACEGDDSYLAACKQEYKSAYDSIPELPFGNIWIAKQLHNALPANAVVHLGILNTLRSWNFFELPQCISSYCNVGGFGIDGIISSLVGASLVNPRSLYFGILGDLAFFYDMNVLGNRHLSSNIRILLINNGRGTEFRNYDHPGSAFEEKADDYIAAAHHFGNKSPNLVKHYAEDLGFEYISAATKAEFLSIVERFTTAEFTDKPILFEVFTDSQDESEALRQVRSCLVDKSMVREQKIKNAVREVIGNSGIKAIKHLMGK